MSDTLYKIRNKGTKLFSIGGRRPSFRNTGKVWKRLSDVHLHLAQVQGDVYRNCEIVTLVTQEQAWTDVDTALNAIRDQKAEKQRKQQERRQKAQEDQERVEARRLIAQYGTDP